MILDEIAQKTRERIANKKQRKPLDTIKQEAYSMLKKEVDFPFERALKGADIQFICEVKKASPSKGLIAESFPYVSIATAYEKAGAAAISVLTEPFYFLGDDQYLKEIKQAVNIPILRKDFTVDEYMIYEAKLLGADAILLICSILEEKELIHFIEIADALGLSALVEAHTKEEVEMAIRCNARIIGVNNRDLKTFQVDIQNSIRLRSFVPSDILFVSESGMKTANDIADLKKNHVNAVLIGETLMRSQNKKKMLENLKGHTAGSVSPKIKICGLRRDMDIDYANQLKPDYIGFVFAKSKRQVSPEEAKRLKMGLSKEINAVGVFVNENVDIIIQLLNEGTIDIVQLHGNESEEDICLIKQASGKPVIKALKVRSPEDVIKWENSSADYLLLDNGEGTGEKFDWKILENLGKSLSMKPFFLAGGLCAKNMEEACYAVRPFVPFGLDVSSGAEMDGYKDFNKMKQIIAVGREL
ncbi:MAG: indole-3-glycerol phosphate synthase TrpC [Velocimicrobium sp.]